MRREVEFMRCAYCGNDYPWRQGGPSRIEARCWPCTWKQHMDREHRPSWFRRLING